MRFVVSLLALGACDGDAAEPESTIDTRVDQTSEGSTVESVTPRMCMGDEGHVFVAWEDPRDDMHGIWFNASADGGTSWFPADIKLNTGDAHATSPDVACAGDFVYVFWEDERDGELKNHNIYANVSENAGRDWLYEDIRLDGDEEGEAMSIGPRAFATGDKAYVAWFDNRNGAYDIYVNHTTDGGGNWQRTASRVDTDEAGEAYSAWPQIAADTDGNVSVVWEDSRDGANDIYYNVSEDHGNNFGAADVRLDEGDDAGSADSFFPQIAVSGNHVYAVWHDERDGEQRDILFNASDDGGNDWMNEAVRVESDAAGQSDSLNPSISAAEDSVNIVWQDDRSGGYDVYHRYSDDGGDNWVGDERRMDTDAGGESHSFDPVVSVSGSTVLVGWQDRRDDLGGDSFDDLYYNYSQDGGASWSEADLRINSNAPGSAYAVDLNLGRSGKNLVAVWADGRFGSSDIFCASRGVGEESVYVPPKKKTEK